MCERGTGRGLYASSVISDSHSVTHEIQTLLASCFTDEKVVNPLNLGPGCHFRLLSGSRH